MRYRISKIGKANLIFLLVISINLIGCKQNKPKQDQINKSNQQNTAIELGKDNLLMDVSRAVCYSGFRAGQHPDRGDGAKNPSYKEVLEDLKILSHNSYFKLIRVYDSGENSEMVLKVIAENNIDIKVMLGIWLKAEISNHEGCWWLNEPIPEETLKQNIELNNIEIETAIRLANEFTDIIAAVNVGNEALVEWNDHMIDSTTIITYVQKVKRSIEQPVTVAENFKWWVVSGFDLVKEVDFISVHVYPLWEGKDIEEGLSFSIANVMEVRNAYPKSKIVITEAGWASVASEFEERASEEKQLQYFNELMAWADKMNITTFFFEAFDEDWKGDLNNLMGAEKHWGLYTEDRKPKLVMRELYQEDD